MDMDTRFSLSNADGYPEYDEWGNVEGAPDHSRRHSVEKRNPVA